MCLSFILAFKNTNISPEKITDINESIAPFKEKRISQNAPIDKLISAFTSNGRKLSGYTTPAKNNSNTEIIEKLIRLDESCPELSFST
ncbi:hypothetical protein VS_1879 [Vibrio atlanticus]|uniref:Uncharacterized protein n=1 Tax=Vibrio atlanticus (strain LGP32) TaxID=575788 RepID=B7VPW2_VIBA3|nr:hypothetical protein VS_1879 [Vibrio atlanticus]